VSAAVSRWAVVGHGRSPEGRGWGSRIDACDTVVRMWDWHWQAAPDHGTRYDYGVIEVHPMTLERWAAHNCRQPARGWVASDLRRKHWSPMGHRLPPETEVIDFRELTRANRHMGAGETGRWELTRGAIAACWAISKAGPGDAVVLVGCDNLRDGVALPLEQAFPQAYRLDASGPRFADYVGGATRSGNHDFAAERRLVEHLAAKAGVGVAFAQDVWA
jgi:hypothetical protein